MKRKHLLSKFGWWSSALIFKYLGSTSSLWCRCGFLYKQYIWMVSSQEPWKQTIWLWHLFEAHLQILRFCQALSKVDSFFSSSLVSRVKPLIKALVSTFDDMPICFRVFILKHSWSLIHEILPRITNPLKTHPKKKDTLHRKYGFSPFSSHRAVEKM